MSTDTSIVVSNDYIKGINGEDVMWTFLVNRTNFIGVDCTTVHTTHTNPNFSTLFRNYIRTHLKCKIIIQNATFMNRIDPEIYTIMYLQDNMRAMGRTDSQQESNIKYANKLVTNSRLTARSYPEYSFEIIPIGVDSDLFKPTKKTSTNRTGIFVGAFNEVKGWSDILRIIQKRRDIHFILVSKYSDGICQEPNTTTYNQISQPKISELINQADFFILGSPVETQCLSAIEAALCDKPIIMKKTGIFMDFSPEDQKTVGFFDNGDLEPYIDMVYRHKFTPRDTIIRNGLSIEGMVDKWIRLIKTINK